MALVILAHPDFSRSIANKAVITRLQHSGLSLEIRDLAALYPDYRIDPTAEQQALLRHHTVLFRSTGTTFPPSSNNTLTAC